MFCWLPNKRMRQRESEESPSSDGRQPPVVMGAGKKAMFCEPSMSTLLNLRLNLMQALQARGFEVVAASPEKDVHGKLADLGIRHAHFPASQVGLNPLGELRTIYCLWRLFRRERPDLVHQSTQKLVLSQVTSVT